MISFYTRAPLLLSRPPCWNKHSTACTTQHVTTHTTCHACRVVSWCDVTQQVKFGLYYLVIGICIFLKKVLLFFEHPMVSLHDFMSYFSFWNRCR